MQPARKRLSVWYIPRATLLVGPHLQLAVIALVFLPVRPGMAQAAAPQTLELQDAPRNAGRADRYARVVLARPLFSAHRRPPGSASRTATAAFIGLPRLSGIVVAGAYRRALFDSDGKPMAGSVGDHVGPYAILAIMPRQVSVTGPAGLQILDLRFGAPQARPAPALGILDRLRSQPYRPPPLPSSAGLNRLLLRPPSPPG